MYTLYLQQQGASTQRVIINQAYTYTEHGRPFRMRDLGM